MISKSKLLFEKKKEGKEPKYKTFEEVFELRFEAMSKIL